MFPKSAADIKKKIEPFLEQRSWLQNVEHEPILNIISDYRILGELGHSGATVGHSQKVFVCEKCMIGKYGDIF